MPTPPARRWAAVVIAALAALALAACGGDDEPPTSAKRCPGTQPPPPKWADLSPPSQEVERSQRLVATVETNRGSFEIALDARQSPKTVTSFVYLTRKRFYNGTTFHRIVPGFVIQGGDPRGTGLGGPGYCVDEPPPHNVAYTKGTVAMAKTAAQPPGRSGSQFFVVTGADAGLPPDYALLGKVSSGEDVVRRISKLGDPASGDEGTPSAAVVIRTITVEEG